MTDPSPHGRGVGEGPLDERGPAVVRDPLVHALPGRAEVVVVGGGPVGSALAIELASRGVVPLVLERRTAIQTADVRARNISVRTLELARRWGVAGEFRARQTLPDDWHRGWVIRTRVAGDDLCEPLHADRPAWTPRAEWHEIAAERPQDLPQYHVNRILRDRAAQLGALFATGWEAASVTDDGTGVTVRAEGPDGATATVRADWVVGADGGRSVVRQAAGIEQDQTEPLGRLFNVVFRLQDPWERLGLDPAVLMFVFNQDVSGMISPFDGDLWRLGIGPVPMDTSIDEDDLMAVTRLYLGADVEPEFLSVSGHVVQKRIARTRRRGRLLLAGDAAQAFPPHLGQNLNSGVGDAATLGWALAAVVRGWGGEVLLDAYSQERTAVAHRLADATLEICAATSQMEELIRSHGDVEGDTPEAVAARGRLGAVVRQVLASGSDGLIFDQRHPDSPIVVPDGSPAPPDDPTTLHASARPGHIAPHLWLGDGDPLSDHFGHWFTLLDLGAPSEDVQAVTGALATTGVPVTVLAVADPAVRAAYEQPLVLIRPDRVVAWRGAAAPADPARIADIVRGFPVAATVEVAA